MSSPPQASLSLSPAVRFGDLIFVSGQVAIDKSSGENRVGDIATETAQVLTNLSSVLQSMGASLKDVVKVTAYLTSISDFDEFNESYGSFFAAEPPARTTVGVAHLVPPYHVEIEAIAAVRGKPAPSGVSG